MSEGGFLYQRYQIFRLCVSHCQVIGLLVQAVDQKQHSNGSWFLTGADTAEDVILEQSHTAAERTDGGEGLIIYMCTV